MSFRKIVTILCLFIVSASVHAQNKSSKKSSSKPNIIYILADDLGIGNVSCYGADIFKTPQIDALATKGVRFTNAYTAPLCGPSRALILTGRYAFRTGATNQDATGRMKPTEETMVPSILKPAGYTTSCVGKWGQLPLGAEDFGFDDYIRFKGSGVYWNDKQKAEQYWENGETKTLHDKEYMPDLMHKHLVNFMAQNKDKPFFIYYPMSHVHTKLMPTPDSKPDSKDLYVDNINYMDKLVGQLVNALDSLHLRENTILVFFGDNGTAGADAARSTVNGKALIGKKGTMQECGSLVPLIVNWPGKIAGGRVANDLIDATDFMPTLAELTGAKLPDNKILDGRSFAPQLFGKKGNKREWIFMQLGKSWYVRERRFKLNNDNELFDMQNAPFEEKLVPADTTDKEAVAARIRLQAVLDKLNPAGGIVDSGDGSGRHANKIEKKKKKNKD